MRLSVIRLLSVFKHLRWRLGLWSPWAGRQHREEAVVLRTMPEVAPAPMPPAPDFAAPVLLPMLEPSVERRPEPDIPLRPEWATASIVTEPAPVTQEVDAEGERDKGIVYQEEIYQEEPRLSGWRFALIGAVVVLISLGSFFI